MISLRVGEARYFDRELVLPGREGRPPGLLRRPGQVWGPRPSRAGIPGQREDPASQNSQPAQTLHGRMGGEGIHSLPTNNVILMLVIPDRTFHIFTDSKSID